MESFFTYFEIENDFMRFNRIWISIQASFGTQFFIALHDYCQCDDDQWSIIDHIVKLDLLLFKYLVDFQIKKIFLDIQ